VKAQALLPGMIPADRGLMASNQDIGRPLVGGRCSPAALATVGLATVTSAGGTAGRLNSPLQPPAFMLRRWWPPRGRHTVENHGNQYLKIVGQDHREGLRMKRSTKFSRWEYRRMVRNASEQAPSNSGCKTQQNIGDRMMAKLWRCR